MTSSRWGGEGGQVKNGQNSDGSGLLQGGGRESVEIEYQLNINWIEIEL